MQGEPVDQEIDSVEKVWAFFAPGILSDKCREIAALRGAGDTLFFEGAIRWRVTLLAEDKTMKGRAKSLDCACCDILECLTFLSGTYAADTVVECSIESSNYSAPL
jgi:hypothetical protein